MGEANNKKRRFLAAHSRCCFLGAPTSYHN